MMFLFILGVLALTVGFALTTPTRSYVRFSKPLKAVGLLLMAFGLLTASLRQIDAGRVGVISVFGTVSDQALNAGLSLVNPLAEVIEYDVKTQNYTMSGTHDEGEKRGDDAIRVLTSDGLEVVIDLTVLYRVIAAETPRIYRQIGSDYMDKIVRPLTRTRIRDNAVYYDAIGLYSSRRNEFQRRIYQAIDTDFRKRGLMLEQLLIRNIDLPASVKKTIESKINAEQDSQKMQYVLTKERQEAERKRVEAQGIADYQKILSTGLSDKQLQYERIKVQRELAASRNAKFIVVDAPGKASTGLNEP